MQFNPNFFILMAPLSAFDCVRCDSRQGLKFIQIYSGSVSNPKSPTFILILIHLLHKYYVMMS